MTRYRVSADIGGTFTDFVYENDSGQVRIGKVPTTPDNPAQGILNAVNQFIDKPEEIEFFVHGTTVGLNALLERRGARVLLLMTGGISDTYTIARGNRAEMYNLHYRKPTQLVPRRDVHEVVERLNWDGSEHTSLDLASLASVIDKVKAEKIPAVAVCLLHAYKNPAHELAVGEYLKDALPGVSVSLSHQVAPEWREFERASSTVMDAYVAPVVELYLETLKGELLASGMHETVHVMRSNGGVMTDKSASRHPISTLMSGPVGGSIGGVELAKVTGRENLLCVDMGGTSFDLSLVVNGRAQVDNETVLEGLPLLMPIVDIETVGTGGGSLAWIEVGGLRVGPQSAGSQPGPVCYGRGGTEPTVTDANLFLGRLGADSLLSGKMTLDIPATQQAFARMGEQLGLTDAQLAEGIINISNAKMADAMRTITVGRGLDPRDFTLVAFGGAGPMHAVELARELDMREVLIPRFPGTFSAWGMLQSDIRHDFSRNYYAIANSEDRDSLTEIFASLVEDGRDMLCGEDVADADMTFKRSIELRYVGQEHTLNVPLEEDFSIDSLLEEFHTLYQGRFGHASPQAPVEMINLRVAAIGRLGRSPGKFTPAPEGTNPLVGERNITFDGGLHATPIVRRDLLGVGAIGHSPVVIEEESSTTIVPPGYSYRLDAYGNLLITKED